MTAITNKKLKVSEVAVQTLEDLLIATQDGRLYSEIMDSILDHHLSPGVKLKDEMGKHLQRIEDKLNLDNERSPGDLYAAFAHVQGSTK